MKFPKVLGFAEQHLNIAGHKIPAWVILAALAVVSIIIVKRAGSGLSLGQQPTMQPSTAGTDFGGTSWLTDPSLATVSPQQVATGFPGPTDPPVATQPVSSSVQFVAPAQTPSGSFVDPTVQVVGLEPAPTSSSSIVASKGSTAPGFSDTSQSVYTPPPSSPAQTIPGGGAILRAIAPLLSAPAPAPVSVSSYRPTRSGAQVG